jgi:hypothetical protein
MGDLSGFCCGAMILYFLIDRRGFARTMDECAATLFAAICKWLEDALEAIVWVYDRIKRKWKK